MQLNVLIVDALIVRGDELRSLLAAHGIEARCVASAAAGQQHLAATPETLIVVPWPQATLDHDAMEALAQATLLPLLLVPDEADTPLPTGTFQRCCRQDLVGYGTLLQRLLRAEHALEVARQELRASARARLLGDIIAGVAHDLNNPLTAILGNAELLPPQPSLDDQQGVEQIIGSARRAQNLAQNVMVIARSKPGQGQWIDSRALIQDTLGLIMALLRSNNVRLHVELAPDLPFIWGELGQLQQALLHLLQNAVQALENQVERQILLRALRSTGVIGPCLQIEISDNGLGIAADSAGQLFRPFFSTRPPGKGAGLGLAIADEIVRRGGGSLDLFDSPLGGAGFRVSLSLQAPQQFGDALDEDDDA